MFAVPQSGRRNSTLHAMRKLTISLSKRARFSRPFFLKRTGLGVGEGDINADGSPGVNSNVREFKTSVFAHFPQKRSPIVVREYFGKLNVFIGRRKTSGSAYSRGRTRKETIPKRFLVVVFNPNVATRVTRPSYFYCNRSTERWRTTVTSLLRNGTI